MLGSPTRAPRIWLDPPPAHSNGLSRYQLYSLEAEPRVAHLPPTYITPHNYEEQVLRRSVSQLSCHQLFAEEKKVSRRDECPCKPLTGWSEKGPKPKDGGCSRTTPLAIVKSESARVPTPCQVPEVTTSSKTDIQGSTSGGIPVGIAIARQRVQQTNSSSPLTVQLTACQDRGSQQSSWPSSLMPSHHYQIRGPDQGMTSAIQSPFQLVRDPMTGQFMLLPSASPALACLSLEGAVQRAVWTGPPPLQVMAPHPHAHPTPQPLLVDRLVTLAPSSQPDKRSMVQVPCDFSKTSPAAQQSLLIHPTMSPHQAFSTLLVHNMPFAATTANHQNSFLLSTQLTEQALINQGGVVISNHLENTVINPHQIMGGCAESSYSPQTPTHVPSSFLHHMSPSVVISSHTETNSFVRDLTPSVITSLDNQVIVKSEMKSEPLCTMDQATSPPTIEVKPEVVTEEYTEEEEERTTIVADAQNQTETPSNSEEEDTQSSVKLPPELSIPKQEPEEEVEEQETSVVQQETTQIVTTQITRTTWTTEQTHHGTVQIEQEEIKEEVEEVVEREQESQSSAVDLSGLELLSNTTIAQHENYHNSSPEPEDDDSTSGGGNDLGGLAVLCQAADFAMSQPHFIPVASTSTSSIVIQESTTTSSTVSTATVSSIEMEDSSKDHSRKLSPPRLLPIQGVEKMREVPLKDAFKVFRAKKVKEKKCAGIEEESPIAEPPVLEPWSAAPQRFTPPLCAPTLTPNKKRSCDSPDFAEEMDFPPVPESYGPAPPPPLKKRKFGRPSINFEEDSKMSIVEPEGVQVQPVLPAVMDICDDQLKNIMRPKSKAELKDFPPVPESYGSAPPPLKKRKFGRSLMKFEDDSKPSVVEPEGVQVQPVLPAESTKIYDDQLKNKMRPKLKAEAKVRAPEDENEEEMLESSLELVPAQLSPSWRFKQNKPNNEKTKLTVKKGKIQSKAKPSSPRSPTSSKATQDVAAPETKVSHVQSKPSQSLPVTRLTESDLKDVPLTIMMYSGGHFVPAQVTDIKAPGIYEVIYLRNPRNRRPQILCTEELLNSAIREVKLENLAVPAGTRVCSYWSQEYNFMYSGVVSAPSGPDEKFVFVEFDDGDDGKINRDDIRLLPVEMNLTDYDPEPSSPLMGRRRRTSDSKSSPDQPKMPSIKVKPLPPPPEEEEDDMEAEQAEAADVGASSVKSEETDESACASVGSEVSEAGSDTPPAIYIKNIVKDFLQTEKEKKEKRRLKKEKKRRLMEKCCKHKHSHKHSHRDGCRSHHKRKHKHHHQHRHKHSLENSELRIINSTVSKTGTESSGNHKGPLVTTISKPSVTPAVEEERKDEEEEDDDVEEEPSSSSNQAAAKGSKFAAFLPARHELWTWCGGGSKRGRGSGQKRGRKIFYKAIQRGSDVINVGDCAVFVSTGRPDRPFIGQVESFWGTQKNSMAVKVSWFYHPEETVGAPETFPYPGALFKSPHTDSNDVQTISHRCEVVSLPDFKARVDLNEVSTDSVYDNQEVYYLAGFYDPQDTSIKYEPGIVD